MSKSATTKSAMTRPGLMKSAIAQALTRFGPAAAALAVAGLGTATILGAYFFQYVLKLAPCPLCLQQRIPYYVAIPLALAVAAAAARLPRALVRAGLTVVALVMVLGAGLGLYHAGIEWRWWPGPTDCAGEVATFTAADLMRQIEAARVVRCDEAPWRFVGLSLAGYNALISLALAGIALWGLRAARLRPM